MDPKPACFKPLVAPEHKGTAELPGGLGEAQMAGVSAFIDLGHSSNTAFPVCSRWWPKCQPMDHSL